MLGLVVLLKTRNVQELDGKTSSLVPQRHHHAYLLQVVPRGVAAEQIVLVDLLQLEVHHVVLLGLDGPCAAFQLVDLLKDLVLVFLDEVVVGGLHVRMPQDVLHEVRGVLVQKGFASLLKDLQHVEVQALIEHLVFEMDVLLIA